MARFQNWKAAAILCGYLLLGALALAGWSRRELRPPPALPPCAVTLPPAKSPPPNVLNELPGGTAGFIKNR